MVKNWGTSKNLHLCIDRFTKFISAKVLKKTLASAILTFLTNYCNLHGLPKSIQVDHGSCFLSNEFKNFCEKNMINLNLGNVGNHRSKWDIERPNYTVKAKFMAILLNKPKPTSNESIDKIILESSFNETTIHWMYNFFSKF